MTQLFHTEHAGAQTLIPHRRPCTDDLPKKGSTRQCWAPHTFGDIQPYFHNLRPATQGVGSRKMDGERFCRAGVKAVGGVAPASANYARSSPPLCGAGQIELCTRSVSHHTAMFMAVYVRQLTAASSAALNELVLPSRSNGSVVKLGGNAFVVL